MHPDRRFLSPAGAESDLAVDVAVATALRLAGADAWLADAGERTRRCGDLPRACYALRVRTTVEFEDDTSKAVEALRRERGIGVSEAVNLLIRRALLQQPERRRFRQRTRRVGIKVDVSNVAAVLEDLDGVEVR